MTIELGVCLGVASAAAFTDWRIRKIRNSLVIPVFIIGLVIHLITGGVPGTLDALAGGVFPLVLLPFFAIRMLGAGDIKLLMALGAWLGLKGCVSLTVYSILFGGLMALMIILVRRNARHRLARLRLYMRTSLIQARLLPYQDFESVEKGAVLPFALAILGGLICLITQYSGLIPPVV